MALSFIVKLNDIWITLEGLWGVSMYHMFPVRTLKLQDGNLLGIIFCTVVCQPYLTNLKIILT